MDGRSMPTPRISIVTVVLNQAHCIESAIRSVLGQGPEPVEYIVIDGGSTDGTREIIERYTAWPAGHNQAGRVRPRRRADACHQNKKQHLCCADRLACSFSGPDRGQSHALNKGFARATGEVVGWLNADDLLLPGALARVREVFARDECDVLCGACRYEYPDGRVEVQRAAPRELRHLGVYDPIHQPSCFWRRSLHERVGGLNEQLHYCLDWDLWLRFARAGARFKTIDQVLSVYRVTGTNKTSVGGEQRNREIYDFLRQSSDGELRLLTELAYRLLWPLKRLRRRRPEWFYIPFSNTARTALLMALGPMFGFDRVRRCTHPFS